jgi:beta-glucanase (GH16 family)
LLATAQSGYKLVWSDEFSYRGLPDQAKWIYEKGYVRNNEKQFYTENRLENARVENGVLSIEARRDFYQGNEVTSAALETYGKRSWRYGKFEVRAKIPTGRGTWPAIWTLGDNIYTGTGWPDCGEIDMMENVGFDPERMHFNVHTKAYNHTIGTNKGANIVVPKAWTQYHIYTVEWLPESITWFFDNKRVFQFKKESNDFRVWPFTAPQFLILNLAIGGGWGGQQGIDNNIFPCKMEVDYVRIYQKK